MNLEVTVQQIRHFTQFGWIEFEAFLSTEECLLLLSLAQDVVSRRLGVNIKTASWQRCYASGRDCWRDRSELRKFFHNPRFRIPAEELTGEKSSVLFVCDQWIPAHTSLQPLNLSAHLSLQGLVCGCLCALEGEEQGRVRFFHPERLPLFQTSQFLIAYGTVRTVYIYNPHDPSTAYLKQFGYNFGDRLAK
jgi:hypothetical protein